MLFSLNSLLNFFNKRISSHSLTVKYLMLKIILKGDQRFINFSISKLNFSEVKLRESFLTFSTSSYKTS